jgi:hypothetical protein
MAGVINGNEATTRVVLNDVLFRRWKASNSVVVNTTDNKEGMGYGDTTDEPRFVCALDR